MATKTLGQDEILDALPATERVALQKSLDYPDNSAGRLMQTELLAVPPVEVDGRVVGDAEKP